MKLKFITQDFQTDAVNAVADLFTGQERLSTSFSITDDRGAMIGMHGIEQNELGTPWSQMGFAAQAGIQGNKISIQQADMLVNLNRVQKRNLLPKTQDIYPFSHVAEGDLQFTIEMETGTGKTYVYTKTIFELNKRYGFTKFIIVVPSVAIREGVSKSLSITKEHFGAHYDNVASRHFVYNGDKLSDVRQFATSTNIEIMIINIDSFNKDTNKINQAQDRLNGEAAINYIKDTNPIVIIDEPQSVANTALAQKAIQSLNPMCILRYSATHREKRNLLYKLTPVDAYQKGLVKHITVIENKAENDNNTPYIHLKSVTASPFTAKIEIDVQNKKTLAVTRKTVTVKQGDDLYKKSGERDLYQGYVISGIDATQGAEYIEFSDTTTLELGKTIGGVDELAIKRVQISKTIERHLLKEKTLIHKDIKVLSLFFIDKVANYRQPDGTHGIYATMFEEEYNKLINQDRFKDLREHKNFVNDIDTIHNGYFSNDKKGYKDTNGTTKADDDTYNLIMKDKEKLLSYASPLRFIFSHSALKEGWDNPNVFQVCTLIEQKTAFTQRQKIGRGLRLCVNQQGERIEDRVVNQLHVIANESYADFASKLQREIEEETGTKFGALTIQSLTEQTWEEQEEKVTVITTDEAKEAVQALKDTGILDNNGKLTEEIDKKTLEEKPKLTILPPHLKNILRKATQVAKTQDNTFGVENLDGQMYTETITVTKQMDYATAKQTFEELQDNGYIDKNGIITKKMKEDLETDKVEIKTLSNENAKQTVIERALATDYTPPANADKTVTVLRKEEVITSPKFLAIWDKIKHKTTYRVSVDIDKLVENCKKDFDDMEKINKTVITTTLAKIDVAQDSVQTQEAGTQHTYIDTSYTSLPDIIQVISQVALVKRSDVARILQASGRMGDFLNNPQAFTEKALSIITQNRHALAIEGISYIRLDGEEYYAQEIFEHEELQKELHKNAVKVKKSVYTHAIYDSNIESEFAKKLDEDNDVKLFFKIPDKFKIQTPIGSYNPDWAVYMNKDGDTKLYFVIETKGTTNKSDLRPSERAKIKCGEAHFEAIGMVESYKLAKDWDGLKMTIVQNLAT